MDKKKILIIKGSGRNEGFSNRLCDEVAAFFQEHEVDVFDTFKEDFLPCNGCNYCEKNGKCVKRDLDVFYNKFENADLIVFASPVYNGTFSTPMKSLIDRFQIYYTGFYASGKKQQIKKHRKAMLIVASGRDGKVSFDYMKSQLECAFSILNVELDSAFLCAYTDSNSTYEETLEKLKRSLKDE